MQLDFVDCMAILRIAESIAELKSVTIPLQSTKSYQNPVQSRLWKVSNPLQSKNSHIINVDHRRIVVVFAKSMQTRAMLQSKGKSVFRHGLHNRGRCLIKTAKIACFFILQSTRNPILIFRNQRRLQHDCKIARNCWEIAKKIEYWNPLSFVPKLQLDFEVVMKLRCIWTKCTNSQSYRWISLSLKKILETQSNRPAIGQPGFQKDYKNRAIARQSIGLWGGCKCSGIRAILARSNRSTCNPEKIGGFWHNPKSNLT